jgi:hypothetical protein
MSDEKQNEQLVRESNEAYGKGDFVTSHHIDRVLKVAAERKAEKEQQKKVGE